MADLTNLPDEMARSGFLTPRLLHWLDAPPTAAGAMEPFGIDYRDDDRDRALVVLMTHIEVLAIRDGLRARAWAHDVTLSPGLRYDDPDGAPVTHLRALWREICPMVRPLIALHEMGRPLFAGLDADLLTTCNTYNADRVPEGRRYVSFIGPDVMVCDPEHRLGWLCLTDLADVGDGGWRRLTGTLRMSLDTSRGLIIRGALSANDTARYGPFLQAA